MIKSVSRSTGLSSVCLIIVLIVPLIQCSSIENEESSIGRFKRNTFTAQGSKALASAESSAESIIVPIELGKTGGWGAPGGWPVAGGLGGWGGAGGKPSGWPEAGGPGGWPVAGGWPGAGGSVGWPVAGGSGSWGGKHGGWEGWDAKKGGSFGKIIGELVPGLDKTFVPIEKILTFDALGPAGGIVDEGGSSLLEGFGKGFGGKGGFEKSAGPEIDYSKLYANYFATQPRGISENQPNVATISVD